MNIRIIYLSIVVVFSLLFILIVMLNTSSNSQCLREEDAIKESINGKVLNVYLDSTHHNYETIIYQFSGTEVKTNILLFEKSGCFDYLQVGDSIVKKSGSLEMKVLRDSGASIFNLNFGCK